MKADPAGPLVAVVFRVPFDPRSNMKYSTIRVFSGTLKSDTNLMHNEEKKGLRPGHIFKSQGAKQGDHAGIAGDIVTLAKIEELRSATSSTMADAGKYQMPASPSRCSRWRWSRDPRRRTEDQRGPRPAPRGRPHLQDHPRLRRPRNSWSTASATCTCGSCSKRWQNRFKLEVNTKPPKIPYRETITAKADGHYRHKKQTGGAGQFGEVYLRVEPAERNSDPPLQFSWDIFGGSIPGQYLPAVEKGVNDVMVNGAVAGFPMQDVKVSVTDGKHHPVDSKEIAFRTAGKCAFIDAIKKAKPALLEPIVNMEVTVPAKYMGDIAGDLSGRRGRIIGQDMLPGNIAVIKAQAPLSEVAQYNSQLRCVTGGQGSYSMELSHYDPVPPNVQQQVVAMYGKKKDDMEE